MNKFTVGLLAGTTIAVMGVGYMMRDQRNYNAMMKNGKKMAKKAERRLEGLVEDMMDR